MILAICVAVVVAVVVVVVVKLKDYAVNSIISRSTSYCLLHYFFVVQSLQQDSGLVTESSIA